MIDKNDISKQLEFLGLSPEEIEKALSDKIDEGGSQTKDAGSEYSEDIEKSLFAAKTKAEEEFTSYMSKKPKIEKSENLEIGGGEMNAELFKSKFSEFEKGFMGKFDDIEKSLEIVNNFSSRMDDIEKSIKKVFGEVRPSQSEMISSNALIQKSIEGGVSSEGKLSLSQKVHKEKIGNLLAEIVLEENGSPLSKSIETDLSNYVSGGSELGDISKRVLFEKKSVSIV